MTTAIAVVEHERKVPAATRRALREALSAAGLEPASWTRVPKARKTTAAVAKAVKRGAEAVVVCGGDGTVRAAAQALADTGVALAVIPTGTANAFARGLDLPEDPAAVVEAIRSGPRQLLDTGRCNDLTFTVMAGTGFDAAMVDAADAAADSASKERLGVLSYVRAGVARVRDDEPFEVVVTVDAAPFFDGLTTCVLIGNLGTLSGGLQAFPAASATDGLLDVGVITAVGVREWASLMASTALHRQEASKHVSLTQGASIDVVLDVERPFELDGERRAPPTGCGSRCGRGRCWCACRRDQPGGRPAVVVSGTPIRCARPPNTMAQSRNQA